MGEYVELNSLPSCDFAFQENLKRLMPARNGLAHRSQRLKVERPRDHGDGCEASLLEILEKQIIPSLLRSNEHSPPFIYKEGLRESLPTTPEIQRFAELCISGDAGLPDTFVQGLMVEGLGAETIFLHLLAPAARHLGHLWDEDLCDFTQVTVGLLRMQQITARLGSEFQEKRKTAMAGGRAMFTAVPGSQHTLGVLMVSEFFRREGWQVWMEFSASEAQLLKAAGKDWFDIIGLSVGTEAQAEDLVEIIVRLRSASSNPQAKILIGGPLLLSSPNLALQVGADGGASDAAAAVQLAKRMLSELAASAKNVKPDTSRSPDGAVFAPKEIMERFRKFRMSRGITIKEAASQLSLTPSSLTKYEQLDRHPKPEILEKILSWIESVQHQRSRIVKKR